MRVLDSGSTTRLPVVLQVPGDHELSWKHIVDPMLSLSQKQVGRFLDWIAEQALQHVWRGAEHRVQDAADAEHSIPKGVAWDQHAISQLNPNRPSHHRGDDA